MLPMPVTPGGAWLVDTRDQGNGDGSFPVARGRPPMEAEPGDERSGVRCEPGTERDNRRRVFHRSHELHRGLREHYPWTSRPGSTSRASECAVGAAPVFPPPHSTRGGRVTLALGSDHLRHSEAQSNLPVVDQGRGKLEATVDLRVLEWTVTIRVRMILQGGFATTQHVEHHFRKSKRQCAVDSSPRACS